MQDLVSYFFPLPNRKYYNSGFIYAGKTDYIIFEKTTYLKN